LCLLFIYIMNDLFGSVVFIIQRWGHLQKVSIRLIILRKGLTTRNP
jgi:hypothetical protein